MSGKSNNVPSREAVRRRAIDFISKTWGSLGDLHEPIIPVVWVTVYRSLETSMTAEAGGGSIALTKSMLSGGALALEFKNAITRIDFLKKMISVIRSQTGRLERWADSRLVIDILKWRIIDAGSMSPLRRTILRQIAKADSLYGDVLPLEIIK
jgi:hypothetical protein